MADFNVGALKGSIQIDYGSVTKATEAVKSLQNQFSNYTSAAKKAETITKSNTAAVKAQTTAVNSSSVSQERLLKAYTQLEHAEKQLLILRRQSAAETAEGTAALNQARASVDNFKKTLQQTGLTSLQLTDAYESMQQQLIRASVATTGLNQATANARTWFRTSRAAAAQMGLQLQDIAVQAQMGTNWLIILGQQGSQILGFFGAFGAAAGAVLAVGAALAYVFSSSKQAEESTKALDKSLDTLNSTVSETKDGMNVLSDEILKYAEVSQNAARIELQKRLLEVGIAVREASSSIGNSADTILGNFTTMANAIERYGSVADIISGKNETLSNSISGVSTGFVKLTVLFNNASKELGITRVQTEQLLKAYNNVRTNQTEESFQNLIDVLAQIQAESGSTSTAFTRLAATLNQSAVDAINAIRRGEDIEKFLANLPKAINDARNALGNSSSTTKTAADRIKEYIESIREEYETLNLSNTELVEYKINKLAAADASVENKDALIAEARALQEKLDKAKEEKKLAEERAKTLEELKKKYGSTSEDVKEFANNMALLSEEFYKTKDPEILTIMKKYAEDFNNIGTIVGEAALTLEGFADAMDSIVNNSQQSFISLAETIPSVLDSLSSEFDGFSLMMSKNMQMGVVAVGGAMDSMMNLLETAGRESTGAYKALAIAQATIGTGLAIANAWVAASQLAVQMANPAILPIMGGTLTALLSANLGAQIAAIQAANYANGGFVSGPGTSKSDDIPAWLSNGEYVMRAEAVRRIGVAQLNAMNYGQPRAYASGGMVGSSPSYYGGDTTVNIIDQRASGAPVETRQSTDEYGRTNIEVLIKDIVNDGFSRGDFDRSLSSYGLSRKGRRY
jgi:hypothetical protein